LTTLSSQRLLTAKSIMATTRQRAEAITPMVKRPKCFENTPNTPHSTVITLRIIRLATDKTRVAYFYM